MLLYSVNIDILRIKNTNEARRHETRLFFVLVTRRERERDAGVLFLGDDEARTWERSDRGRFVVGFSSSLAENFRRMAREVLQRRCFHFGTSRRIDDCMTIE